MQIGVYFVFTRLFPKFNNNNDVDDDDKRFTQRDAIDRFMRLAAV